MQASQAHYVGVLALLSALNLVAFVMLVGRLWRGDHGHCADAVLTSNPLLSHCDVSEFLTDAKLVLSSPIVHAADVAEEIRLPLLQHRH